MRAEMDAKEVGIFWGVNFRTVLWWTSTGLLKPIKIKNRKFMYSREDVENFSRPSRFGRVYAPMITKKRESESRIIEYRVANG